MKRQKAIHMEEKKKTKRQLEKEAEQRERANSSFIRGSERLLQWMAFKDFVLNDFYKTILELATSKEDLDAEDDYGFSIYLYNTNIGHHLPHFSATATGLGGLLTAICEALDWLQEECQLQGLEWECETIGEADDLTCAEEMENGLLRSGLSVFTDACETIGSANNDEWVNLHIAFHPTANEVPETLDWTNLEFESLCYPDSLLKRFESISNDIIENHIKK